MRREREIHVDLVVHGLRQVVRDPVRPSVALHVLEARVAGRRRVEDVVLGREDALARVGGPDQGAHEGASVLVVIPQLVVDLVVHALQQGIARGRVRDRQDRTRLRRAFARELGRHRRGEGRVGHVPSTARAERAGAERRQHAALDGIRQRHHVVRRAHGHEVAHEHAVTPDLERIKDQRAGRLGEVRVRGDVHARAVAHRRRAVGDGDRVGAPCRQLDVARDLACGRAVVRAHVVRPVIEHRTA